MSDIKIDFSNCNVSIEKMFDIHDNQNVNFYGNTQKKGKTPKRESKSKQKSAISRELMTFSTNGIVEAHLSLLFLKLTKEEWISGNEADFKLLFSGKRQDISITWNDKYGKSTLEYLFKCLIESGLITIANGFTISNILEGHFLDTKGNFISGLGKGNEPNAKALPIIQECIKLLKVDPTNSSSNTIIDFEEKYDPYDQQDLHLHRRH